MTELYGEFRVSTVVFPIQDTRQIPKGRLVRTLDKQTLHDLLLYLGVSLEATMTKQQLADYLYTQLGVLGRLYQTD